MTYLAHHGILGQKWGIRRYQNKDGSLTKAGKERYLKEASEQYKKSGPYATTRGENQNKIHEGWSRYDQGDGFNGDTDAYRKHAKELGNYFYNSDAVHDMRDRYEKSYNDSKMALEMRNKTFSSKKYKEYQEIWQNLSKKAVNDFDQYAGTVENLGMEYINKLPKNERDAAAAFIFRYLNLDW